MQITYGRLKFERCYLDSKWEFDDGNEIKEFLYGSHEYIKCLMGLGKDGWRLVCAFGDREFILEKIQ